MVLYTVDSLLLSGKQAIIGLTTGDFSYSFLDLICNCKTPSISETSESAYLPEPASLLLQCACIDHVHHGKLQNSPYMELILSEDASAVTQIHIDTQAGSWEPLQEQLLVAWMSYISDGLGDKVPYAFNLNKGDAESLNSFYRAIAASEQDVIFTVAEDGVTLILGFRNGGRIYGAMDILTRMDARKLLAGMLRTQPVGYVTTKLDNLLVYCALENTISHTLCIPANLVADISDLPTINAEFATGIKVSTFMESSQSAVFPSFSRMLGDSAAIGQFQSLKNPRVYTMQLEDKVALYAVYYEGAYLSLYDICRLQAAYDKVAEILGTQDIPCYIEKGLKLTLALSDEMQQLSGIVYRDCSAIASLDSALSSRLLDDFNLVTKVGVPTEELNSKITLPSVRVFTLTHFGILRGDFEAVEEYNQIYTSLHPPLTNVVQDNPTALLSRALPTYKQLTGIYSSEDKDDTEGITDPELNPGESSDKNDGKTKYFLDQLAGVEEGNIGLEDYSQLDMNISLEYMPLTKIFPYYDCVHYKNAIAATGSSVDPALIEGNANNNTLPIQDNELRFYMGLRNLVIYGICVENNVYTLDELEKQLAAGVHSTIVDAFLENLSEEAYALNWVHTGHVLADASATFGNDDEEDDSISMSIPGRYYVEVGASETGKRQERKVYEQFSETEFLDSKSRLAGFQAGMPRISAYAKLEVKNPFTWIEIAIRLLRWGARKPNSLYVPSLNEQETGPRFLNMSTLIISGFSGTFTNMSKRTYGDNNASYTVHSAISFDVTEKWASDLAELNTNLGTKLAEGDTIPCGVTLSSTFLDLNEVQYFSIDIFTLASQISKGQINVYGVSYDQNTGEFSCDTEPSQIFDKGGQQISYVPEEFFSSNKTPLWDVIASLNTDPIVYTQSKCAYLVKYLRVMDEKLSGFKTNQVSIFDLLKLCATPLRWDCIAECEQLFTIANNDERRDRAAQIRAAYQLSSIDEILVWMVFAEAVRPFLNLAMHMRDKPKTLASTLKEALAVQAQMDSVSSSARSMQANTTVDTFEQLLPKCVKYYQFMNPLTNDIVCYAGVVENSAASKILIWMPSEVQAQPQVAFETRALPVLYKEWILPIIPYYKAVAAQPKDMSARKMYQAQLNARFIQASQHTFSSILKVCIEVSKQQKAQR